MKTKKFLLAGALGLLLIPTSAFATNNKKEDSLLEVQQAAYNELLGLSTIEELTTITIRDKEHEVDNENVKKYNPDKYGKVSPWGAHEFNLDSVFSSHLIIGEKTKVAIDAFEDEEEVLIHFKGNDYWYKVEEVVEDKDNLSSREVMDLYTGVTGYNLTLQLYDGETETDSIAYLSLMPIEEEEVDSDAKDEDTSTSDTDSEAKEDSARESSDKKDKGDKAKTKDKKKTTKKSRKQ